MPERSETVASCQSCGKVMNVTAVAPFTNVTCPSCGEQTRVKREFGPYTLTRRHAVGGMSMVFVAHDPTLDREVALKILSEQFSADEKRIAAFEEEARITASFSHPHVVRVLTTGKAFGRFYIAMELVPGGHFEHQIRERGKIPEMEILPLAIEVAEGLKAAHSAGLIHRDIKPGNILLDAENHAKIVDFGLALVTQGGKAQASEIWATPYYVPPETIEGAPEDFRSDIYAFGATLYHALAGVPSCGEETMATDILREAKRRVVPLGTLEPSLSVNTSRVVDRAMAYDPNQRYTSYDEMISQLKGALGRLQSGTAGSNEAREIAARRRAEKKRSELMVLGVAGIVLIASITAGIWWVTREAPRVPGPPPVVFNNGSPSLVDSNPDDGSDVVKSYRAARAAVESGDFEQAGVAFSKLLDDAAVQEPTRTWAGTEAVVSSYLAGNEADAARRAKNAWNHAKSVNSSARVGEGLIRTLEGLPELPGIPAKEVDRSHSDASTVMMWMLAGLKDWEQGLTAPAAEFFSAVASARFASDDAWLAIYQKIARDYLADGQLLAKPVFETLPADVAGCDSALAELETMLPELKTRGRARFNVRAWQLDIKRHAKLLAKTGGNAVEAGTSAWDEVVVMGKLREYATGGRFDEATGYLEALNENQQSPMRTSLLAITSAAGQFLADLRADLGRQPVTGEFILTDGSTVRQISADGSGAIRAIDVSGNGRLASWSDFPADTLIAIHRVLLRNPATEPDRPQRNERAIAYDWIAGDRERARAAADQLALTSMAFKERWQKISTSLPE